MGPTAADWKIRLEQLHVLNADEDNFLSNGDEPYVVAIGFRSKFKTPGSTHVSWGEMLDDKWGANADGGEVKAIPAAMGVVGFDGVERPSLKELMAGARPEILGTLVVALESDNTPFGAVRDKIHQVMDVVRAKLVDLVENGNIDPNNPQPAIQKAVDEARDSLQPSTGEAIVLFMQSFGDPDDLVGVRVAAFGAVDPVLASGSFPVLSERTVDLDFPADGVHYRITGRVTKDTRFRKIRYKKSGMCLDVRGGEMGPGGQLNQFHCHDNDNQQFAIEPLGDGSFKIVAKHSGMVLDVADESKEAGAKVIQFPFHGGANQRFLFEPRGGDTYRIVAKHSGLALGVVAASSTPGADVIQVGTFGQHHDEWLL